MFAFIIATAVVLFCKYKNGFPAYTLCIVLAIIALCTYLKVYNEMAVPFHFDSEIGSYVSASLPTGFWSVVMLGRD
jgi:hypothetical protein